MHNFNTQFIQVEFYAIGTGESVEDPREFTSKEFAKPSASVFIASDKEPKAADISGKLPTRLGSFCAGSPTLFINSLIVPSPRHQ